ncbi:GALNT7 [Bugula neritina]|uniref:Polypeptide N-acetylgalactosaminyltransferase n=1 Tax=Bugula neritina TaxID=10212 RepID=A0A7J7JG42_BUGNE|nr:GALNT7 [Bugula neritina]
MRLTINNLLKIFAAIIFVVFVGPSIVSFFDRPSGEESYHKHRRDVKHSDDDLHKGGPNIDLPNHNSYDSKKVEPQFGKPKSVLQGSRGSDDSVIMGPTATLKKNTLGNFEPVIKQSVGPGENGEPVFHDMSEDREAKRQLQQYGFNMVVSDKIAMNRTIPDTRLDECKYWHYPTDLPSASVILVFHNEGFSTLVRTVHSVINTSPPQYLKEIVMVDDFSDKEHLKDKLEEYLRQFKGLVKLFRNSQREGLIRTRTIGAQHATGDVIIFLDAHCECNRNWLVPLLARIRYNRKIMAVPTIDGIDFNTFRVRPVYSHGTHYRGIFEWGFLYKESEVPQRELDRRAHFSEPYRAPTHAGGLFAMDRSYFFELGAYDDGLLIWGGENFELSFKIWQCGGEIEWVPCSRVAHVYRNHMPYSFGKLDTKIPIIQINYMRVVEVWLDDEYKEYFYTREPSVRGYDIGDISKQLAFKKEHKCKSFKWFMNNIAYEVFDRFPPPPPNKHWGMLEQEGSSDCWDAVGWSVGRNAEIYHCHKMGGSQLFRLNTKGQLASGERCLIPKGNHVQVTVCPTDPSGHWEYLDDTKQMKDTLSGKCAGHDANSNVISMLPCDSSSKLQQFTFTQIKQF